MPTTKERLDKHERQLAIHDRQITAIRDLVREGIRLMVEFRKDMRALAAAQKRTDASLKAYLDSLKGRSTNGHTKRKRDLE